MVLPSGDQVGWLSNDSPPTMRVAVPPRDRQRVEVAEQVEDDRAAVGRDVDRHPRDLVGREVDRLRGWEHQRLRHRRWRSRRGRLLLRAERQAATTARATTPDADTLHGQPPGVTNGGTGGSRRCRPRAHASARSYRRQLAGFTATTRYQRAPEASSAHLGEAGPLERGAHVVGRHAVAVARREVEHGEASAWGKRRQQAAAHGQRIVEVMEHVAHEERVAAAGRQVGLGGTALHDGDVGESAAATARAVASRCRGFSSLLKTRPAGPTSRAMATVSAPAPAPISPTVLPGSRWRVRRRGGRRLRDRTGRAPAAPSPARAAAEADHGDDAQPRSSEHHWCR